MGYQLDGAQSGLLEWLGISFILIWVTVAQVSTDNIY